MIQLVVITGMSGAGKASAAKVFEDLGYTVVDNLPPGLLTTLVAEPPAEKLAVVIDARSGAFLAGLDAALSAVKEQGVRPTTLFLDASDAALVQRFKETRRRHPLFESQMFDGHGGILGSVQAERAQLENIKEGADKVVDTSDMDVHGLRNLLLTEFSADADTQGLIVTINSFGFKYGLPLDADLVFDVRFLVNPHYVDDLRPYDGRNQLVEEYVMADPDSGLFLTKLYDLMDWSIPRYTAEGKAYLTVSIGCTGGRHRSVVVSEKLGDHLRGLGYRVLVQHRDVNKGPLK